MYLYLHQLSKSLFFQFCLAVFFFNSCSSSFEKVEYVDPFIGTGGHGHTFPGATTPFGMVQLSPDTRIEGWDGCSGYHFSDSIIYGFSHTHLSGTGVGDYCDLLLMPSSGKVLFNNGYASNQQGYCSSFRKENEYAKPGIYKVLLDKDSISVALTSTDRVGIHKYKFSKFDTANVIIDLEHRDPLLDWSVKQISTNEIVGHRISRSWAENQHFYFYLQTSANIDSTESYSSDSKDSSKLALRFVDLPKGELIIKVGISSVSSEGAKQNLIAEASHWNFDTYQNQSQLKWENALSKINVIDSNTNNKTIFYTALYHSMIAPNIFNDINGDYRGTDLKVHHSKGDVYTVFSLWDTFRATHPLYTIIEQEKTKAFNATFLKHFKDGGQLPIWELSANYTGCMIGYHVVSVIYDAVNKGIEIEDEEELLKAMVHISNRDKLGIPEYISYGYIPQPVTKGLSLKTRLEASYSFYENGDHQEYLGLGIGPELILGNFKNKTFDYTRISLFPFYKFDSGESVFKFDHNYEKFTLKIAFDQQLLGPVILKSVGTLNLTEDSEDYGEFIDSKIALNWKKRSYEFGIFYQPHNQAGGISFSLFGFE